MLPDAAAFFGVRSCCKVRRFGPHRHYQLIFTPVPGDAGMTPTNLTGCRHKLRIPKPLQPIQQSATTQTVNKRQSSQATFDALISSDNTRQVLAWEKRPLEKTSGYRLPAAYSSSSEVSRSHAGLLQELPESEMMGQSGMLCLFNAAAPSPTSRPC